MNLLIVMGVSGAGKTTIGEALADKTGLPFYDADDYHPQVNIDKMRRGVPLDDADRWPWLSALNKEAGIWLKESGGAILACSALKENYREALTRNLPGVQWIVLEADQNTIARRLESRRDHFIDPGLLASQFDALESPDYGWHVDVRHSVESIVQGIVSRMETRSSLGVVGMGVMGRNLALNFLDRGYHVSVFNRHVEHEEESVAANFVKQYSGEQIVRGFDGDLVAFVRSLDCPRKILLMVPAGAAIDQLLDELMPLTDAGDILLDGGNSHFRDTEHRIELLDRAGIKYLGVGISGGKAGARRGPSIMAGGSPDGYEQVRTMLESVAALDSEGAPCCGYVGPGGAGHYVKMVHNGIEYAEMQLIAELHLLFRARGLPHCDIAAIFDSWCDGPLDSYLLKITIDILNKKDGDSHLIDRIPSIADYKGTGIWAAEESLKLGVPAPTIIAALTARQLSSQRATDSLNTPLQTEDEPSLPQGNYNDEYKDAYRAARLINHIIGFELIKRASDKYHYHLDRSKIAGIWTSGCIISSRLMSEFAGILPSADTHLFIHQPIQDRLAPIIASLRQVVAAAIGRGLPVPAMAAAAGYANTMTWAQSGAALIQAQRDYFGQHGFQRIDGKPGTLYHGDW